MALGKDLQKLNQDIAAAGSRMFSSMTAFWLFFFWGLLGVLPGLPARFQGFVLLISSAWIQLWALPLIAVGSQVLNRASERRAAQDHVALKEELTIVKHSLEHIEEILAAVLRVEKKLDEKKERRSAPSSPSAHGG